MRRGLGLDPWKSSTTPTRVFSSKENQWRGAEKSINTSFEKFCSKWGPKEETLAEEGCVSRQTF